MTAEDQLLTVKDVAALTHIGVSTLHTWRHRGVGPPSFKLVGRVVYRESELLAWITDQAEQTRRAS